MKYVALLRGINVGGNRKVSMSELKALFEKAGMEQVKTYINSGNVVFTSSVKAKQKLTTTLEAACKSAFGFDITILIFSSSEIATIAQQLPDSWSNDGTMKSDVIFLWPQVDHPDIVNKLTIKPGVDTVLYTPGAVLWGMKRELATKSGLYKLVGTPIYKQMTVRNCNTLRKLAALLAD